MDVEEPKLMIDLPPLERSHKEHGLSPVHMTLIVLLFVICGVVGFFAGKIYGTNLIPPDAPYADVGANDDAWFTEESPEQPQRRVLTVLIMGLDQRYKNEPARSDTVILGCINLDTKQVDLISIPRDTRTAIPDRNLFRKINYAHTVGGAALTQRTIQELLQIPVDYYVETNFKGFSNCIDILGGISLDVERRMYHPEEDIDLYAGVQTLNGYNALAYCRWRGDNAGDIGRIERQQKFLKALQDQVLQLGTLTKLTSLVSELLQNVATNMTPTQIIKLTKEFIPINDLEINFHMLPGNVDNIHYGGSYWILDQVQTQALIDDIFSTSDEKTTETASASSF